MSEQASLPPPRGFTLVELLVVMVLLGLISALLFGGLRYTARVAVHGTAVLDRTSDIVLATDFLRAELADARPLPEPESGAEDGSIAFSGGADRVALVGTPPPHLARGGFFRVEIAFDRDRHVLTTRSTPLPRDDTTEAAAAPPASHLIDQVARAQFAYFGALGDEDAPSWHDAWQGQRALPSLVRLRIGFTDGAAAPDLIVAVRTGAGAPR